MTALHTEHYAVLVSFISRYVRDRHKAEDQMQETLLRAWKHIDHLDTEPGRTRSYLLTIARNVVTTAWRAEHLPIGVGGQVVGEFRRLQQVNRPDHLDGWSGGTAAGWCLRRLEVGARGGQ